MSSERRYTSPISQNLVPKEERRKYRISELSHKVEEVSWPQIPATKDEKNYTDGNIKLLQTT